MLEVATRELKARLSTYLDEVRHGKRVSVTHHGHVIAEICPPPQPSELHAEGIVITVARRPFTLPDFRVKLKGKGPTASQIVIEDRR